MKVQICVTECTDSSSVGLHFFMMSGQALCKYCTSVGSSCFCYMRWLISLYQSLHCFWSIFCMLVPSPSNTNWSLLNSLSSVWGWGSWSCHAFPRSTPACGLVPTCKMKKMLAGSILGRKWGCWYVLFKSSFHAGCAVSFSGWMLTGTTVLSFIAVVCPCGYFALLICHKSVMPNVVSFPVPLYHLQRFLAVIVMSSGLLLCGVWV